MPRKMLTVVFFLVCCQVAHAADPFHATAVVGSNTGEVGFTTAEDAFNALRDTDLNSIVPYAGFEVVNVTIDFRGLEFTTAYPIASDPTLALSIPALGISRTFVGLTRDDSLELLKDYFKDGDELNRIMRELAKVSPVDPIAGNPSSLQSRMVSGAYARSFRSLISRRSSRSYGGEEVAQGTSPWLLAAVGDSIPVMGGAAGSASPLPHASAGLQLSRYRQAGLTTVGVTLPVSYSFDVDPDRQWSLAGDLHYTDTESAKTYSLNLGGAFDYRVNERWYLIPALNYGLTASEDLGSLGQMLSLSLTSAAMLHGNDQYSLWMGNAINYMHSLKASIGDYSFDPGLRNTVFVNGLVLATPLPQIGRNYWIEYSIADTRFTGSDLYDERQDEFGIAVARAKSSGYMRLGVNYLDTSHSKGWMVSFHAAF